MKSKNINIDNKVLVVNKSKEQQKTNKIGNLIRRAIDQYNKWKAAHNEVIEATKDKHDYKVLYTNAIVHTKKQKETKQFQS